jgi:hypothetical protein
MTTLRDLVGAEPAIEDPRSEYEDAATAQMPGDDPEDHPLHSEPNPYTGRSRSELRQALRDGFLSRSEERLVRAALTLQQKQHNDGKMPGRPDRPPIPAPPTRQY